MSSRPAWLCALAVIASFSAGCGGAAESSDAAQPADFSAVEGARDLAQATELGEHALLPDMDIAPPPDLASPPSIVSSPIPYAATRLSEMATYSLHHYGVATSVLVPQLIVLHFTDTSTWTSAFNLFSADTSNRGELPGTCSHYIVEQDGTIHALVGEDVRCRHAVGMNHVALGIEMVESSQGKGGAFGDGEILARPAQIDAVLHLVKWLQLKYGIATDHVIGHAMANASPLFLDLEGWTNDHVDWLEPDVIELRKRLDALP